MRDQEKKTKVLELIELGWSHRKIHRETGFSRTFIDKIVSEKRMTKAYPPLEGRTTRCKGCGGMVRKPCLKCRLEKE